MGKLTKKPISITDIKQAKGSPSNSLTALCLGDAAGGDGIQNNKWWHFDIATYLAGPAGLDYSMEGSGGVEARPNAAAGHSVSEFFTQGLNEAGVSEEWYYDHECKPPLYISSLGLPQTIERDASFPASVDISFGARFTKRAALNNDPFYHRLRVYFFTGTDTELGYYELTDMQITMLEQEYNSGSSFYPCSCGMINSSGLSGKTITARLYVHRGPGPGIGDSAWIPLGEGIDNNVSVSNINVTSPGAGINWGMKFTYTSDFVPATTITPSNTIWDLDQGPLNGNDVVPEVCIHPHFGQKITVTYSGKSNSSSDYMVSVRVAKYSTVGGATAFKEVCYPKSIHGTEGSVEWSLELTGKLQPEITFDNGDILILEVVLNGNSKNSFYIKQNSQLGF